MNRQTPKGITGSVAKRVQDESPSNSNRNNDQELNYEKLVADMTKGFFEAQSQANKPQNNNQDMITLLEKLSMQIDTMKNNLDNNAPNNSSNEATTQGQETISAQTLKDLFSSILQTDANKQNLQQDSSQNKNSDSSQPQEKNSNKVAVQAAAQVLAQAQYELSNELEASLTKLRQVISKSEKIADKISSLLGSDNNKQ